MAAEMGQVNAVLAADSFQQDPFLAIQARILAESSASSFFAKFLYFTLLLPILQVLSHTESKYFVAKRGCSS